MASAPTQPDPAEGPSRDEPTGPSAPTQPGAAEGDDVDPLPGSPAG